MTTTTESNTENKTLRIAVTGSSGLVGTELQAALKSAGHTTVPIVRRATTDPDRVSWDLHAEKVETKKLEGLDGVVHLAGESIAEGRWTAAKKARIRDSRVRGTDLLCRALAQLDQPPKVLVSASAIGFYGDRGAEICDESTEPGTGFLPDVCREWEAAAAPAREAGIRVVNVRIGIVLSSKGGALSKMLLPFKLGAGGKLGSGKQYMSWISLPDLAGVIQYALVTDGLTGPVNAVAPHAVTNLEFTKVLGRVLNRPTLLPAPAFALRLALGEMADALLLASTRVVPKKLTTSGYPFQHPELEQALSAVL